MNSSLKQLIEKVKAKLFWNAFIRYSLESYLKWAFVSLTVLSSIQNRSLIEKVAVIICISILSTLPFIYLTILFRKREMLTQEAQKAKIGSLFLGIRHFSIFQASYSVIFLLRRLAFIALLVFLEDRPCFVVMLVLILNMTFVCYVG